jgi:hypothetical protein
LIKSQSNCNALAVISRAVESSHYTVNDGVVMLVEENGVAVDRHKLIRKLKPARTRALLLVH